MFTGIIEALGEIQRITSMGSDFRLILQAREIDWSKVSIGDSIAVNGVCLTVVELTGDGFVADASQETMRCTTLQFLEVGTAVNLELALTLEKPLGGHLVSGHVDGLAKIQQRIHEGRSVRYLIEAPKHLARYIAAKGSVCLDGVSLTVNQVNDCEFDVNIIPHTQSVTNVKSWAAGQLLNLEVDLLARYIERLTFKSEPGVTMQTLIDNGFAERN